MKCSSTFGECGRRAVKNIVDRFNLNPRLVFRDCTTSRLLIGIAKLAVEGSLI